MFTLLYLYIYIFINKKSPYLLLFFLFGNCKKKIIEIKKYTFFCTKDVTVERTMWYLTNKGWQFFFFTWCCISSKKKIARETRPLWQNNRVQHVSRLAVQTSQTKANGDIQRTQDNRFIFYTIHSKWSWWSDLL